MCPTLTQWFLTVQTLAITFYCLVDIYSIEAAKYQVLRPLISIDCNFLKALERCRGASRPSHLPQTRKRRVAPVT